MSNEEKHQIWCYFGIEKFVIGNNEELSALLTKLLRHHHKRQIYKYVAHTLQLIKKPVIVTKAVNIENLPKSRIISSRQKKKRKRHETRKNIHRLSYDYIDFMQHKRKICPPKP